MRQRKTNFREFRVALLRIGLKMQNLLKVQKLVTNLSLVVEQRLMTMSITFDFGGRLRNRTKNGRPMSRLGIFESTQATCCRSSIGQMKRELFTIPTVVYIPRNYGLRKALPRERSHRQE